MIKEKDIKVGAKFCWDGEKMDKNNAGTCTHILSTVRNGCYSFANKSEYPTIFTIVEMNDYEAECLVNEGAMSIVMSKDDIMRFAHIADAEEEELDDDGSLSIPLKVEFGESTLALHHAEDVATMRQVLLQIVNWFKTGHRKLPLTLAEPFNDSVCNDLYGTIYEWMKDEKEEKNG
jgi:hypothetical protein